jgi:uncharacterized protein (TIGR03435 family)
MPTAVIVGRDRRIVGFGGTMMPDERVVTAALEDAPVLLDAEAHRMPRPDDHKPDFPPSYTMHISPATGVSGGSFGGPDYWSFEGFRLKDLIREVYAVNYVRLDLATSVDNGQRYNFSLVLPEAESKEQIYERFQRGIQEYFHLAATRQERLMDIYVVTAPDPMPTPAKLAPGRIAGDFARSSSVEVAVSRDVDAMSPHPLGAIRRVSMKGTMNQFCFLLESLVDRPVVNETNSGG